MKYVVILGDGMADYPSNDKAASTPLSKAKKPNTDNLAKVSELGLVKTIPDNMSAGSDTANLSVLGYNPEKYYSGRSPLEAISIGIDFTPEDLTLRCNLVTLSDEKRFSDKVMLDYSAGEITTTESKELIGFLQEFWNSPELMLYSGISYRHCLVLKNGKLGTRYTPPHDILDKRIGEYLPSGLNSELLISLMERSNILLRNHPINLSRISMGLNPANAVWFWGEGKKPTLPTFRKKYGVNGAMISAVDLLKGIGIATEMEVINVEGATGNLDTNFTGKATAAIEALKNGKDFVYIHIEAPDECGHHGSFNDKVKAIELIDEQIVGPIITTFKKEDISIMILPDHPTPVSLRTHVKDPVPYLIYRSNAPVKSGVKTYNEHTCAASGNYIPEGWSLMWKFIKNK